MSLNQEVMNDWADALESGEYEQCSGMLRNEVDAYCCLGVLSELAVKAGVIGPAVIQPNSGYGYGEEASTSCLPVEVGKWAGVELDPEFQVDVDGVTEQTSAVALNDGRKLTFPQIAKLIRSGAVRGAPEGWISPEIV